MQIFVFTISILRETQGAVERDSNGRPTLSQLNNQKLQERDGPQG